ncbi:MAG: hypothetical protein ACPGJS_24105 [Flammeovirgaceae bacterium]
MDFKFEANIEVFETLVELRPMEGDEIGYRAKEDEAGIVVDHAKLITAGFFKAGDPVTEYIPNPTTIKTIVFNRKTKKFEFAVEGKFDENFILNKYPTVFKLKSIAVYIATEPKEDA